MKLAKQNLEDLLAPLLVEKERLEKEREEEEKEKR